MCEACRRVVLALPRRSHKLVTRDGRIVEKHFAGIRVPKPCTRLAVKVEWDEDEQQLVRRQVGFISWECYMERRRMSKDADEISEYTEPARVVTAGVVKPSTSRQMGLREQRRRRTAEQAAKRCECCQSLCRPGDRYCHICLKAIRAGDAKAIAELLAYGEARKAERLAKLRKKTAIPEGNDQGIAKSLPDCQPV
jgi:hypothetical protein